MTLEQSHAGFTTTRWSLVTALQRPGDEGQRKEALDILVRRYWPPVYAVLRRRGCDRERACDITQDFFADVVFARQLLDRADRQRGSLRSLVLAALKRFLIDRHRREQAKREPRSIPSDALLREDRLVSSSQTLEAEEVFNRRWAMGHLEEAIRRCKAHYLSTNREGHWTAFEARILRPALSGTRPTPYDELARDTAFTTRANAAAAVAEVRKRMTVLIRQTIAETTSDADSCEEEFLDAIRLLS